MPEYVQIGNEITAGMLWPDGRNTNAAQWAQLGQLMKAAVQGIKDASGSEMPKVIVHIDKGGDWGATQWFFDNLNQQQVPFDIIGESYYPFWHGTLDALRTCLTNAVRRYSKPVIVAETAFPFTNSPSVQGIPATPEGQVQFAKALARTVKGLPNNMGAGVFWWGTEYQTLAGYSLAGFNHKSFFDHQGNLLPVADTWGQLTAETRLGVELEQGNLRLWWPVSGAGMVLVSTTNPASSAAWLPVEGTVGVSPEGFSVTVPLDPVTTRLYRLTN
jgi:arabinogalactan endo-1,4-beta-galactosidase